jgi:hypothetical protein
MEIRNSKYFFIKKVLKFFLQSHTMFCCFLWIYIIAGNGHSRLLKIKFFQWGHGLGHGWLQFKIGLEINNQHPAYILFVQKMCGESPKNTE